MNRIARFVALLALAAAIAGCAGSSRAPVIERSPAAARAPLPSDARPPVPAASAPTGPGGGAAGTSHTVRRGDTLYSIALDSGHDYRDVAAWNGIADPNVIREGQLISLKPPPSDVQVRPIGSADSVQVRPLGSAEPVRPAASAGDLLVTEPKALKLPYSEENLALLSKPRAAPAEAKVQPSATAPAAPRPDATARVEPRAEPAKPPERAPADAEAVDWSWPANGKVLAAFSDPSNKGVDIAGRKGEPVQASAGGRVVYIGEGLRGYGKLVIIKHNELYLSAYAHNDAILVKEGQTVVKGQKIGEIGSTGTDQTKLHFEIRRQGKPVDPLKFLPERRS
jgi:lipoprotein NlpD